MSRRSAITGIGAVIATTAINPMFGSEPGNNDTAGLNLQGKLWLGEWMR